MMIAVFLYPLMYWYITIPEILYIIYAGLRSVARGTGMGEIYFIGLAIYYSTFIWNQTGTMVVTAALILIDIICHAHAGRAEQAGYSDSAYIHHDTNKCKVPFKVNDNMIEDACDSFVDWTLDRYRKEIRKEVRHANVLMGCVRTFALSSEEWRDEHAGN